MLGKTKIIFALTTIICLLIIIVNNKSYSYYKKPDYSLKEGIVSINFDDNFLSVYENALPILDKAGFKSSQYVITGYMGKKGYMSKEQILEMYHDGHEIGPHTRNHSRLAELNESQMREEIIGSKVDLKNIGIDSKTFAYPYGSFNELAKKIVMENGYVGARITQPLLNDKSSDRFLLKRQRVELVTSFDEVKSSIDKAINEKKWLILVFHKIDNSGEAISISKELFEKIVSYLEEKKVPVVTNEQAIALISQK